MNYYELLEVSPKATEAEIKKAFRQQAKKFHPDLSPGHEKRFILITQAYETLSDPKQRQHYDQKHFHRRTTHQKTSRKASSSQASAQRKSYTTPSPSDSMEDLFEDIDALLNRLGVQSQNWIEKLLSWAKMIFQEVMDDTPNSQTSSHSSSHSSSKSQWQTLWEEMQQQAQSQREEDHANVDSELASLKQKYQKPSS